MRCADPDVFLFPPAPARLGEAMAAARNSRNVSLVASASGPSASFKRRICQSQLRPIASSNESNLVGWPGMFHFRKSHQAAVLSDLFAFRPWVLRASAVHRPPLEAAPTLGLHPSHEPIRPTPPAGVPKGKFDPNTGKQNPKFDPDTGVQNW